MTLVSALLTADPSVSAFGYHVTITQSLLVYLVIAAIVGLVAETIVGWRIPFGIIGAILASLVGIWLLNNVIPITISNDDVVILGTHVALIKTLLGAFIVVGLWHLITYPAWSRRHRYYRGYRNDYRRYRRDYY